MHVHFPYTHITMRGVRFINTAAYLKIEKGSKSMLVRARNK